MSNTEKLITWDDVAARYGKSRHTIRRWPNEILGFPQPIRICRKLYFSLPELEDFESRFVDRFGAKTAE